MVDWVGNDGVATSARYRDMGEHQVRGISPSYERLCLGVADDADVLRRLDTLAPAKRQPNLLLAAVRFLDGPIDEYADFRRFVLDRWDELSATMLARATQTNEAARCTATMPVLAALPQPLALLEVGASAGLCLQPDRYAYRYDDRPVLGESPLVLSCRTSGAVPMPRRLPQVVWRHGLDLNPLDVRDADEMRWLRSLVWPEQTERFAVLQQAIELARADPPPITKGDLVTDLVALAATAPRSATLVIYHSAVLSYLDADGRARLRRERTHDRCRPSDRVDRERGPRGVRSLRDPARRSAVRALEGRRRARPHQPARSLDRLARSVSRLAALGAAGLLAAAPVAAPAVVIRAPAIDEASGIASGIRAQHTFYVQNDSGDSARFFAVDSRTGQLRATFRVPGATNHDWEDLAVAPDAGGTPSVWLADTGDNDAERSEVQLYRVDEAPAVRGVHDTAPPDVWRLRYPTGPVDAESLFVTPHGRAYLVTKVTTGRSTVYAVPPRPDAGARAGTARGRNHRAAADHRSRDVAGRFGAGRSHLFRRVPVARAQRRCRGGVARPSHRRAAAVAAAG